jgi:hypothetical protein
VAENNDIDQKEVDCYTKIINLFLKIGKDPISIETWKDKAILKIMNMLKDPKNKRWVKNALIILLSLFDDKPPDLYSNLGKKVKNLSNEETEQVISKLKDEFSLK